MGCTFNTYKSKNLIKNELVSVSDIIVLPVAVEALVFVTSSRGNLQQKSDPSLVFKAFFQSRRLDCRISDVSWMQHRAPTVRMRSITPQNLDFLWAYDLLHLQNASPTLSQKFMSESWSNSTTWSSQSRVPGPMINPEWQQCIMLFITHLLCFLCYLKVIPILFCNIYLCICVFCAQTIT